jgi:hypothetical protein
MQVGRLDIGELRAHGFAHNGLLSAHPLERAIRNTKVLKTKLGKSPKKRSTAAAAVDLDGSAQPHGSSESRRPIR